MTTPDLPPLPVSTIEVAAFLDQTMNPIQEVDYWTENRVRIRPTRITVKGWKPTHAPLQMHVVIEGRNIRLSDHVESRHDRRLIYVFERERVSDRLVDEGNLDPELRTFAHDARARIERAFA